MRLFVSPVLFMAAALPMIAQETPQRVAWSQQGLQEVFTFTDSIGTAALLIVSDGVVIASRGRVEHSFRAHSLRKSMLSALVGIAVHEGVIDTTHTLGQLGINDSGQLTTMERTASVIDLLAARSGVYHSAASETSDARAGRPARGSYQPDKHWYYNNWDFNALGTIYSQLTGQSVGEAFEALLAGPLGMEDFQLHEHFRYQHEPEYSQHPAYKFRVSARDLARFGTLFLNEGRWEDSQILPAAWVVQSTTMRSRTDQRGTKSGYGLMWWVTGPNALGLPEGSFTASGSGGQRMTILPGAATIIVHLMDTDDRDGPRMGTSTYNKLVRLVLEAQIR